MLRLGSSTSLEQVLRHVGLYAHGPSHSGMWARVDPGQRGGMQTERSTCTDSWVIQSTPRLLYTQRQVGALAHTALCMETCGTTHRQTRAKTRTPRPEGAHEEIQAGTASSSWHTELVKCSGILRGGC